MSALTSWKAQTCWETGPGGLWRRIVPALVLVLGLLVACSSSPPPSAGPAPATEPGLRPGDVVRISVWREPDLSGQFSVDDRGIVTLPLLGETNVTGREASTLQSELMEEYRRYLQNPSIEVRLLRRINVLGAVNEPGLYPVDATVSLSEVLGLAGGIAPNGDADDIQLAREGQIIRESLDRRALLGDFDIRSGDRILVGEKSWVERNPGALIGSLLAAVAGVTIALIR